MNFIFSENYNIYPIGFPMSLTGYTWLGKVGLGKDGNSVEVVRLEDNNNAVSLKAKNGSCGLSVWFDKNAEEYVFESDIKFRDGDAIFSIYADDKDDYLKESIFSISKKDLPEDDWIRIGLILNFKENSGKAYIDGKFYCDLSLGLKKKAVHDNTNMIFIKVVSESIKSGESIVLIDNSALYEGNSFIDQSNWNNLADNRYAPSADFGVKTNRMKKMLLMCIGTRAIKRFGKNDRLPHKIAPYNEDGRVMLPLKYVKECFLAADGNFDEKQFISVEDVARLAGCDFKLYKTGLVALGDKNEFFDEENEANTVKLITKLLKSTDNEVPIFTNENDFVDIKKNAELNRYPISRAWEETKKNADAALNKNYPMILQGYVEHYMQTAIAAAGAVRDLAMSYRVTEDNRYLKRAVEILEEWATAENPFPVSKSLGGSINGLVTSRSMVPFAYAYSIIYNYIDEPLREKVEEWFVKMGQGFIIANEDWIRNDYFEKQYYQNHIVVHMMGIVILGLASRNIDLLSYALYPEGDNFSYEKLIEGAVIGYDDKEIYEKDPCFTHNYPMPHPGEMYDRYRARVGKGLHYSSLNARCLLLTAEALYHYGYDYYSFKGAHGETLDLPFEFYSDFYLDRDTGIKGGYYKTSVLHNSECYIFPIAARRFPENKKLQSFIKKAPVAQFDSEQLGWTAALTHMQPDSDEYRKNLPDVTGVYINQKELNGFSKDMFIYDIEYTESFSIEAVGNGNFESEIIDESNGIYTVRIKDVSDGELCNDYRFRMKRENRGKEFMIAASVDEYDYSEKDGETWTVIDLTEVTKVAYILFDAPNMDMDINLSVWSAPFNKEIWQRVDGVKLSKINECSYKLEFDKQNCRYLKLVLRPSSGDKTDILNTAAYNIR